MQRAKRAGERVKTQIPSPSTCSGSLPVSGKFQDYMRRPINTQATPENGLRADRQLRPQFSHSLRTKVGPIAKQDGTGKRESKWEQWKPST